MKTTSTKLFIDFAAVKAAVTIAQILERYGLMEDLRSSGNGDSLRGCCPIHKGSDPTQFSVSLSKNCWNCFSDCQSGGNVLDLVARIEDVTIREAALRINDWFNLGLDKQSKNGGSRPTARSSAPSQAPEEESPEPEAKPDDSEEPFKTEEPAGNKPLGFALKNIESSHAYFEKREISPETVEHFGLGYCNRGTMAGRIVIPIHNVGGQLVGYAGRWPSAPPAGRPKYKLPTGFKKSAEVFNLHRAAEESPDAPLVLVEGFFDCIKLWQLGIRRCAALMGSSMSPAQEQLILGAVPKGGCIELLLDEDDAGRTGREKAACRLGEHAYVRIISLPREGMQPDHLDEEELVQLFE